MIEEIKSIDGTLIGSYGLGEFTIDETGLIYTSDRDQKEIIDDYLKEALSWDKDLLYVIFETDQDERFMLLRSDDSNSVYSPDEQDDQVSSEPEPITGNRLFDLYINDDRCAQKISVTECLHYFFEYDDFRVRQILEFMAIGESFTNDRGFNNSKLTFKRVL